LMADMQGTWRPGTCSPRVPSASAVPRLDGARGGDRPVAEGTRAPPSGPRAARSGTH
jgi:hypothetical protein